MRYEVGNIVILHDDIDIYCKFVTPDRFKPLITPDLAGQIGCVIEADNDDQWVCCLWSTRDGMCVMRWTTIYAIYKM